MKMKRIVMLLALLLIPFLFPVAVSASETAQAQENYYAQLFSESGAEDLPDHLPKDTKKALGDLGVEGTDWKSIPSITPQSLFGQVISMVGGKSAGPLKAAASVVAVMLLCALLSGMKLSFGEKSMSGVIGMIGTLCVCALVIQPIVSCISNAAGVIHAAAGFLLACVPVIAGIMIAAGQPASAGSYNLLMMGAGNVISLLASHFLVPMLNIFLSLSIVSAISPVVNLGGLCSAFNKAAKWIMGFCMTLFTGLLTMHSLVANAVDTTGTRAAKFVVSSFVPVVGSALGEALYTVNGCVKMLKSGVGAFGLLAGLFIFLPVLIEGIVWVITLRFCAGIGGIFDQKEIVSLLEASVGVLETMIGIVLCCMLILTVSTVIVLIIGGGAS